ncbi:MAG: hypothetical protein LBV27_06000 [Oscillospiraceae bacterium]|nr:hypothetical protein [Oscillospiraceae bacterium]
MSLSKTLNSADAETRKKALQDEITRLQEGISQEYTRLGKAVAALSEERMRTINKMVDRLICCKQEYLQIK